jgi:hypothetical protein
MSSDLLTWLLSLSEAALFFAGGVLFALYRAAAAGERATQAGEERHVYQSALADTRASGEVLRAILERETSHGVAGAVIADDLGLIIAGKGELCEVLAAYGAVLAGVGDKTREALPLRQVRKLVIEDECNTRLTVRPIASADDQFALVTLSCGQQGSATGARRAPEATRNAQAR